MGKLHHKSLQSTTISIKAPKCMPSYGIERPEIIYNINGTVDTVLTPRTLATEATQIRDLFCLSHASSFIPTCTVREQE